MKVFLIIISTLLLSIQTNAQCLTKHQYLAGDGITCNPCPYNCLSCSDSSNCLQCVQEYYITNSQQCEKCLFGCSICTDGSTCSICNDGLYLTSDGGCAACQNGVATCTIAIIQTCQENYFLLSSICAGCYANCKTCLDFVTCAQCDSNYYLAANSLSCLPCPSNCLICSHSTNCISCESGYNQNNGLCVSFSCSHIDVFCKSCSSASCLSCQQGKHLDSSGKCQQGGSILCLSSSGPYLNNCQTGDYGCASYSIVQLDDSGNQLNVCLPKKAAKTKQYIYLSDISFACASACNLPSSLSIQYATTQAYYNIVYRLRVKFYSGTAQRNLVVKIKSSNGTVLSNQTQTLSLSNQLAVFGQTDPSCLNCAVSHKTISGSFIVSGGQSSTKFELSDSAGLFQIVQAMFQHSICQVRFCSICKSQVDCTSCFSPYLLQLTSCVQKCDSGFYKYSNTCYLQCPKYTYTVQSTYTCQICNSPCLTCSDSLTCRTCVVGTYLEGSSCLINCSSNYLFTNSTTMACEECPNPCVTCSITNNVIKCLSCAQGYLFNGSSCVFMCPWGQFGTFLSSSSQCSSCSSNCTQCYINSNFCSSCTSGFLLYQSSCNQMASCPSGYFSNNSLNTCQSCHYPCSRCQVNKTFCKSCLKGSLLNNQCLNKCPSNYYSDYADSSNITCKACQSPCSNCENLLQCTSCLSGFYLFGKSCLAQCPANYYAQLNSLSCISCKPPCKTCQNQTSCLSCTTGYLDNFACTLQCNSSSYIHTNFSCKLCTAPCQRCYSQTYCIYCSLPFLLFNEKCIALAQCSVKIGYYPQYYPNEANKVNAQCKSCTFPCSSCSNNSITCLTCQAGYLYVPNLYKCAINCSTSYFQSASTCQLCDNNCYSCGVDSKRCTGCSAGFYLQSLNNSCVTSCPQQFYGDDSTKSCLACILPCKACYNAYLCMSCTTGIFYLKQCVQKCPSSTFQDIALKTCVSCTNNCLTCISLSSNCLSCVNGYFLSNGSCIASCPSLYYENEITKVCQTCSIPCLQCSSATNCISCMGGFYFMNNECISSCPSSYFPNTLSNVCQPCNSTICLSCVTSQNNCLSCNVNNGYYLYNSLCVSNCLNSSYPNYITGACQTCTFPCSKCTNSTYCQLCQPLYYLFENRCFSKCPIGYYANNISQCQKCSLNCQTCTSSSVCLQCVNGFYILSNDCVDKCPLGYYLGNQQMTNYQYCFTCDFKCLNCTSSDFCFQCVPGLIIFNGLCLTECPLLHYKQNVTSQCNKCSNYCTSCINSTHCLKCIGSFLYNNQCIQTCPNKTYSYLGTTCEACKSPCDQCTGDYTCKTCLQGYIYFHQYCVVKCPSDVWYYPHNNSCNAQCPYNKHVQSMQCYVGNCGLYMVSLNGYCLKQCSSNYYINTYQECVLCSTNPSLCSNLFQADLRIVYIDVLTLVLYFNQISQLVDIKNINVQFKDISGLISTKKYTSYQISSYKVQIKYDYQEISLNNITITLPFVKSKETSQSIFKNSIETQIKKYEDYGTYQRYKFVQLIPLALMSIMFVLIIVNICNKNSHFTQILDYAQIVAVTLYLDIQYPPILENFIAGFKLSLGLFAKNLVNIFPYNFSSPKFIYYHIDTSLIRSEMLLLIVFLVLFIFFIIVIIANTYKPSLFSSLIKIVRYRWINDLFAICITPLYLFSFQITSLKPFEIFLTVLLSLLGIGYVSWISYKIVQVKKLQELQGLLGQFQKTSSKLGLMYIPFAYIRRFVLTFGLGVAPLYPISTLTLLMVLTFLIMICIYFYEPFDNIYTDYVTIFMECSLTLYIVCLVVMALQTISSSNNHNFAIFLVALISVTFAICLSWLIYLTVSDIRSKGCCPKAVEDQIDLQNVKNDYSETKSQKNRNQQAKEKLQQQKKKNGPKNVADHDDIDYISANDLLNNRFNGRSDELYSNNRDANEQFKHWSEQNSQNSDNNKKSESNLLPEIMIKNQLKKIQVFQPAIQVNDNI